MVKLPFSVRVMWWLTLNNAPMAANLVFVPHVCYRCRFSHLAEYCDITKKVDGALMEFCDPQWIPFDIDSASNETEVRVMPDFRPIIYFSDFTGVQLIIVGQNCGEVF